MASATEPAREADPEETAQRHARGQGWASLMARTFGCDVLACPRCGGRLRLIALISDGPHVGAPEVCVVVTPHAERGYRARLSRLTRRRPAS